MQPRRSASTHSRSNTAVTDVAPHGLVPPVPVRQQLVTLAAARPLPTLIRGPTESSCWMGGKIRRGYTRGRDALRRAGPRHAEVGGLQRTAIVVILSRRRRTCAVAASDTGGNGRQGTGPSPSAQDDRHHHAPGPSRRAAALWMTASETRGRTAASPPAPLSRALRSCLRRTRSLGRGGIRDAKDCVGDFGTGESRNNAPGPLAGARNRFSRNIVDNNALKCYTPSSVIRSVPSARGLSGGLRRRL